ncbi:hypothetical protein [Megamonas funiformis]|uniref:hypothetical protein n=1 Tax=Megamonas funiformis TaxID=437897 RepID=UPI0026708060|nr:hypothetical protein [Megamonas funiformis]
MLLYKKTKKKRPAFMLVSALLATLILMMIAHGFMLMYGGQFTYLQAAKTASEGQQYAELVGEKVKLEGIDAEEVTSKTNLDTLTGNDKDKDWQYTYEISDGTEDDNGNIFKVATIKIYKDGENSPRYTYEVPLSSLSNPPPLTAAEVEIVPAPLASIVITYSPPHGSVFASLSNASCVVPSNDSVADNPSCKSSIVILDGVTLERPW